MSKKYKLIGKEYEDLDTVLARVIADSIDAWIDAFPEGLNSHPVYWNENADYSPSWEEHLRQVARDIRLYTNGNLLVDVREASNAIRSRKALAWVFAHFDELWD